MTRGTAKRAMEALREKCCPICLDTVAHATTTPCGHRFCRGCIRPALNIKRECPVCRSKIATHRALRYEEACEEVPLATSADEVELRSSKEPRRATPPQAMTEREAERLAVEERLSLLTSPKSGTGYKGVYKSSTSAKFVAETRHGGKKRQIGHFSGPAEAALAIARNLGPEACAAAAAAEAKQITDEEARRLAQEEGLLLLTSDNATGYKGVTVDHAGYQAKLKKVYLGTFRNAAAAALAYARALGPEGCAAVAAAAIPRPPMTEAEAQRLAAEEGLSLVKSDNAAGFKGISPRATASGGTVFRAHPRVGVCLGTFVSAPEAALALARVGGPDNACTVPAADSPRTPVTEAEEWRLLAVEGGTTPATRPRLWSASASASASAAAART